MKLAALLLLILVLPGMGIAEACNPNNPMDLTCPPGYWVNRVNGSVGYYINNGPARWAQLQSCAHPNPYMPPNRQWCAAAWQAQSMVGGVH